MVEDSGEGIAPEHLAQVFEPFFRADASRARDTGGAGLGLAVASRVAVAHGGRIAVDSHPGKGSIFTVTLPLADSPVG